MLKKPRGEQVTFENSTAKAFMEISFSPELILLGMEPHVQHLLVAELVGNPAPKLMAHMDSQCFPSCRFPSALFWLNPFCAGQ